MDARALDQFAILFDTAPLGIVAVDVQGQIVRANPALEQMFGYPPGLLLGQQVDILLPEALRSGHQAHRRAFLRAPHARPMGQGLDLQGRRRDGQIFSVEVSLSQLSLDDNSVTVAFVADVSERVRLAQEHNRLLEQERQARHAAEAVEQARRLSEQRFRAIFDETPLGMLLASPEGRIIEANPAFQRMLGYSTDELRAIGPQGFVHPDDLAEGQQIRADLVAGQRGQTTMIRRYMRKDGETIRVSTTASFVQDSTGSRFLLIVAEDVTARLATEEARARLAAIIDSTDDAIIGSSIDGTIFTWNAAAERLYGYSAAEIIGMTRSRIIPEDRQEELWQITAAVASGQSVVHVETVRRHKSGQLLDVSLTFSPIVDATGAVIGLSAIARDIGERKRVERLLARQAALARVLQTVAVAANQSTAVREALQLAVDAVCDGIGWPVGHVYLAEEGASASLVSTDIWHLDDPARFAAFRTISESLTHNLPEDLPGRVLRSGEPEWIDDLFAQPAPPRFGLISELGVRSGFAFPVLVGSEVAAILEFFAAEPQTPDVALLEVMANVGAQLGRAIERERAEQALRKSVQMYRTLARNLPNGSVLLFDHQLRFTIADGSALTLSGYIPERIEGRTLHEVLSPARAAALEPYYRAALRGEHSDLELQVGERLYRNHFLPVQDKSGAVLAGMAMSYDITELKQVERELREERELLARRVAERTADLSLANAELARAARLKDEFLANMSHELRTPLNSILGRCEVLAEGIYGALTPKQTEMLRGIEESGHHLLSLINDILDLSKIESGRLELELEPVEIGMICHTCLRMVTQLALMKRITLSSALDSVITAVHADERRLKQILVNLLSNAVKFTPAGGRVGLEVHGDDEQGTVTFTVWDTGIGIAAEDLARLFQPFVQIDSSLSRQYSGTGLGLALVLRLAEAHGGSVAVESTPGQGSRFSVILPWVREVLQPAIRAEEPIAPPVTSTISRVLMVEDSLTVSSQLTRYLRELDAWVERLARGDQVVSRAVAFQPHVIILDILLPDESGWEVLRALKAEPRTQAIPVVVVSVVDDPTRASKLGAAAFLLKPLNRAALVEALGLVVNGQAPAPAPTPYATQPRVLIAEDNQANIDVLQDYLQSKGYAVTVARNGSEATALALEEPVDLILMDIQMPGMDGLEATRRLRAHPDTRDVPIIALTALAMPGDRERCLEAGATAYLAKPLHLRTVLAVIEQQLGKGPRAD